VPETFQALGVVALALLPGALYVWAFERLAGAWGISLSDRLLRFVGLSAIIHAAAAPITYQLWITFVRSGRLAAGRVPLAVWLAPLFYVAVPIAVGTLVGYGTRRGWAWAKLFTGPEPAPRAWDHLFGARLDGWVRLRLRSGTWLAGAYARRGDRRSYAAGYPEIQDLYLAEAVAVDPDTGPSSSTREEIPSARGRVSSSGGRRSSTSSSSRREADMGDEKSSASRPLEKRGGYEAGPKQVSELKPPPEGPAPGAKPGGDQDKK
jgi:hypothetical protein